MSREPLEIGEWYHCYTRGVDKRTVFETTSDFQRFLDLLYLSNSSKSLHRSDEKKTSREEIYTRERGTLLVSIGAYALLRNHFHLLLLETAENGISAFMQKLGIAYTMYFNIKNERVGNLFVKPFRSRHVANDQYFQHCVNYIHLNPVELFFPEWKEKGSEHIGNIKDKLLEYPYSSVPDFYGSVRPENRILGEEIFDAYQKEPLESIVQNAAEYYTSLSNVKMLS